VGTSKHGLFQQQKSKQLNLTLLKEKLRLEILVKEKKLRDAKDVVRKDAGSDIKAGNVPTTEKSPLQLIANAPGTAFEHGETLTPLHERGVLQEDIHADKLSKLIATVTANAPLQVLPDPCVSAHTTLQACFVDDENLPLLQPDEDDVVRSRCDKAAQEPHHPITHGALFPPSYVGGILQTQIEAESAVQVTETTSNDRPVDKAPGVGIDDHTHKARRLLPLIQAGKIRPPSFFTSARRKRHTIAL